MDSAGQICKILVVLRIDILDFQSAGTFPSWYRSIDNSSEIFVIYRPILADINMEN